jgi:hypothetical protein
LGFASAIMRSGDVPRYHFNVAGEVDAEGWTFSGLAEAKCQAAKMLGAMVIDEAAEVWEVGELCMSVTDERGLILFSLIIVGHDSPSACSVSLPDYA